MNNISDQKSLVTFPKKWILIRGLTRSYFHWFDFTKKFEANFFHASVHQMGSKAVLSPELPGNGYLYHKDSPDDLGACVSALKLQLQTSREDLHEPVGVVGISLGGMIATKWALEFPTEVSHLVLINSSFALSPFYQRLMPRNYLKIIKAALSRNPVKIENFILAVTCNTENWKNFLNKCIQFQKDHPITLKNLIKQISMAKHSRFVKKPDCKVLILTAKLDRLVSYKCSLKIANQWGLTAEVHPTAGHDLPMDDTNWILSKIQTAFIKKND